VSENNTTIEHSNENRWLDGLGAIVILVLVIAAAIWIGDSMSSGEVEIWHVLVAASITAVATGFGALPFLFVTELSDRWLGIGNALAAGLMLGASIGLVVEGASLQEVEQPVFRLIVGMVSGVVLVLGAHNLLENRDEDFHIGQVEGANAVQMLMIVGIMTAHSFAEGIGVGVSYGDGQTFGAFISTAIAIHNIPEGLAISLILIPRGTSVLKSALWSIFSSVPQPLMAVPAFLFVLAFRPFLPVGLGLAAGAMFWMVFRELLPEALEDMPRKVVYPVTTVAVAGMLLFQSLIG
jgi:ZIP family zinc transporter